MGKEAYDEMLCNEAQEYSLMESRTWLTRDGKYIPVNEMTTSHIKNCINLLREGNSDIGYDWISVLKAELNNRDDI
jgi:hypothetical protein